MLTHPAAVYMLSPAAGAMHSLLLLESGALLGTGSNHMGQLGGRVAEPSLAQM